MEKTWNADLFRKTVSLAAEEEGVSKAELYMQLGDLLNLSSRSVQAFAQPQSKGPSADRAEKLQQFFGIDFYSRDAEAVMLSNRLSGTICTDFQKEHLLACRNILRMHIQNLEFCDNGLADELEQHMPALPQAIAERIETYIDYALKPLERRIDNALSNAGEEVDGRITFASAEEFFAIIAPLIENALADLDSTLLPLLSV